jgi:hypothetical protein
MRPATQSLLFLTRWILPCAIFLLAAGSLRAQIPSPSAPPASNGIPSVSATANTQLSPAQGGPLPETFFADKIFPVLKQNCFKCHSHASGKSKGGLMLDSANALTQGGDSGPALTQGEPQRSLLLERVHSNDPDKQMPPKGDRLDSQALADLETWIQSGAPWPENLSGGAALPGLTKRAPGKITDQDRQWWAFRPITQPQLPPPAFPTTGEHPVDRFLEARLAAEGMTPAGEAAKRQLIRRLTLDVTGLPPTPSEVEAFLQDDAPTAYETLVDRLLQSPRYGERMARLWMDLVRYADSDGYRVDDYRPTAWRYRDYLVDSFNTNKAYNRFVQEQIAGDELFPGEPQALTATGFLRMWIYEYNNRDVRTQWDTILNDITDTTADVFLGLGLQCARCHDHKFDPILQRDYYALQAFFANVLPRADRPAASPIQRETFLWDSAKWEEKTAAIRRRIAAIEAPYRAKAEKEAVAKFPEDIQDMIRKAPEDRSPLETQLAALAWRQVEYDWDRIERVIKGDARQELSRLQKELAHFEALKPPALPAILSVSDVGTEPPPTLVPKKGTEVFPAFLSVLSEETPAFPAAIHRPEGVRSSGRRSALAMWLTRAENPLTARVMVNRLWQMHFKKGLAPFSSDFGKLGEPPSHPELLDWLSARFIAEGWDLKKMHRLLLTSAAYRRSTEHPALQEALLKDPTNQWLWRMTPNRLEAEQIRDSIFAVTGELKEERGGTGVPFNEPRRSVYTRIMRNTRDPLTDVFDAPLWFSSASSREVTTTPIQSLLLINSPFMLQRAKAFAERLQHAVPASTENAASKRIELAYQLAFNRPPSPQETDSARLFLLEQEALHKGTAPNLAARSNLISEKIPFRDGSGTALEPDNGLPGFRAKNSVKLEPGEGFTVEAFILPRTVAETGALRTIVAKWNGSISTPGWSLGVTGMKSRRTPMVLAIQTVGTQLDGKFGETPYYSGLRIQMNKPYFVAAALKFATPAQPGSVTFSVKDLSNDDEPLLIDTVPCNLAAIPPNEDPVTIGCRSGARPDTFHGVLDDIRFSQTPLPTANLLLQSENTNPSTLGFWRFESKPDLFADLSGGGHDLEIPEPAPLNQNPKADLHHANPRSASSSLAAFCHALLNSSEFLYSE